MATEEEFSLPKEKDNLNETEENVGQNQQEDTIINESQEEAEEIYKQENNIEQILQENEVAKTEEKVEQIQTEDEIIESEEIIQTVMDLEQAPSIKEDDSNFESPSQNHVKYFEEQTFSEVALTEFLEIEPEHVEIESEEFQTAVIDLDFQIPFTSSDGLIPPPPTPAVSVTASNVQVESSEHNSTKELSTRSGTSQTEDKVKITQKPKTKNAKRAEFKIGFIDKVVSDGSDYDSENKVIKGTRNREIEKQQSECNHYAGFEKFASNFVDKLLDKSITMADKLNENDNKPAHFQRVFPSQFEEEAEEEESNLSSLRTFEEVFGTYTKWPRIREFSKDIGKAVLDEFMQTWEYDEDWTYCIDFLLEQSDECSEYYLYEAKWSVPSKPYPIPQATASVYFTIEVSRVKPPYCPVDVTYVFEGSRTVHTPGKIPFREHWLFSIIDAKLEMYKQIKF